MFYEGRNFTVTISGVEVIRLNSAVVEYLLNARHISMGYFQLKFTILSLKTVDLQHFTL